MKTGKIAKNGRNNYQLNDHIEHCFDTGTFASIKIRTCH